MKKYIPIICCVLSCLLTVLCLFRISALEDRLYSLQNSVSNMHSVLHDDIRNIATNVKNSVEEGNNLLSTSSYSLEDPNLKNGTVDLSCIVTLKEFEPDGTTAVLTCNDQEYPMNLKNGDFVAKFPVSIFEESRVTEVSFSKDGVVRTQALDWYISPRDEFIPRLHASFSGTSSGSVKGANTYNWNKNGTLHVSVEQKGGMDYEVESLDLIRLIDGVEAERISITNYFPNDNTAYFGKSPLIHIINEDPLNLDLEMKETFECPFGSTMLLIVEMTDNSGYIHRAIVDEITVDADGKLQDDTIPRWHGAAGNIYDSENNLIYGVDWNDESRSSLYK